MAGPTDRCATGGQQVRGHAGPTVGYGACERRRHDDDHGRPALGAPARVGRRARLRLPRRRHQRADRGLLAGRRPAEVHPVPPRGDVGVPGGGVREDVGPPNRSAMGGSYQQEVDLASLFKDVASDYVQTVTLPQQLPNLVDRAIRVALSRRAPTALIIPNDVQELDYEPPTHDFKMVPS